MPSRKASATTAKPGTRTPASAATTSNPHSPARARTAGVSSSAPVLPGKTGTPLGVPVLIHLSARDQPDIARLSLHGLQWGRPQGSSIEKLAAQSFVPDNLRLKAALRLRH